MQQPQPQPQPYLRPPTALDRKTMGKYEVLCRLAAGGMAEIFLAYQRGLAGFRKIVVLKSILPDIRGEEELVRMFLAEAQITAQFNHPHIATVFDLDIDGDVLFLAMEFVQGCTLIELARSLDKAKEPMPIGFTLRAVRDTALALHYAHTFTDPRGRKQPVIHRDVAEKNIMVTHEGVTKLLDFGIAKSGERKMTMVGTVKGSTGYMSPEQIRGQPLDTRTDVFSLGVVLHECLTGYRLFRGRTPEESMMKALEGDVHAPSLANPEIGPGLDAVVLKALERDREHRYATALELARELERVAGPQIWAQEQCGTLVQKHFSSRKDAVRELILGMEASGESGISDVVAAIQQAARAGAPTVAAAVPPVAPPPLPGSDQTVPAPISEVKRLLNGGKADAKTEEVPALPPPGPSPTPIDFSLFPDPESTPAAPVSALERVTDLASAHVPANPPAPVPPPLRDALPTAVQASQAPVASQGPLPDDPLQGPTAPAAPRRPPSRIMTPAHPSRRIRRKQRSRAPLYGLIALVWAAAVVAVLMVLQVGPFARPAPVVVVKPPAPPPAPPKSPEPEPEASPPEVAPPPDEPAAPAPAAAEPPPEKPKSKRRR